jgi:L-2-aminoadipate reductase
VYPYAQLRGPNVIATLTALTFCTIGKAKKFLFISSTSVLDTEHYVRLSDSILSTGGQGIPESDELMGSGSALPTGYGQSKWVSEQLVLEAGRRGLKSTIIRPGYIVGDSVTGGPRSEASLLTLVSNTDDFLIRLLKGCVQLGLAPEIYNTVNMVPVDHVAHIISAASLVSLNPGACIIHVTGHPRSRFVDILSSLSEYGFNVSAIDYVPWRIALERYTILESKDNALYPLLHFVLDDLPQSTKAPELDDKNAQAILKLDLSPSDSAKSERKGVTVNEMGLYLSYLVAIGFLEPPRGVGRRTLPKLELDPRIIASLQAVGGRGRNQ